MDLVFADVKGRTGPTHGLPEIDIDNGGETSGVAHALVDAAGRIAQGVAVIGEGELHPGLLEPGPARRTDRSPAFQEIGERQPRLQRGLSRAASIAPAAVGQRRGSQKTGKARTGRRPHRRPAAGQHPCHPRRRAATCQPASPPPESIERPKPISISSKMKRRSKAPRPTPTISLPIPVELAIVAQRSADDPGTDHGRTRWPP